MPALFPRVLPTLSMLTFANFRSLRWCSEMMQLMVREERFTTTFLQGKCKHKMLLRSIWSTQVYLSTGGAGPPKPLVPIVTIPYQLLFDITQKSSPARPFPYLHWEATLDSHIHCGKRLIRLRSVRQDHIKSLKNCSGNSDALVRRERASQAATRPSVPRMVFFRHSYQRLHNCCTTGHCSDLLNGLKDMLSPLSLNHRKGLKTAASLPQTSGMRPRT